MGLVHIYCGDGKGKTTAATGLAVRALGSGMKVLLSGFYKNGSSSEIKELKELSNIDFLYIPKHYGIFKKIDDNLKIELEEKFHSQLDKIITIAPNYDLVILDEIISAYNNNMINKNKLETFVANQKKTCEIVMTGRNPHENLIQLADYVSEIKMVKHPYENGIKARKGIEF